MNISCPDVEVEDDDISPDDFVSPQSSRTGDSGSSGDVLYEIEKIVRGRLKRGKLEYLIKWKGYSEKTWEPESGLNDVALQYLKEHPVKISRS